MKRRLFFALTFALGTVAATAADADQVAYDKAIRRYEAMSYYQFCNALGASIRSLKSGPAERAALEVATTKYGINYAARLKIGARDLMIGMPVCGVVAALGTPSEVREIVGPLGKSWSIWYRDRQILIYADQSGVTHYSR